MDVNGAHGLENAASAARNITIDVGSKLRQWTYFLEFYPLFMSHVRVLNHHLAGSLPLKFTIFNPNS